MGKILLVDDNEQNCELLADVVSTWGHEVHTALNGMDAVRLALKLQPDVVLLDVMLPGMNGFEVCRELRNQPGTDMALIILLTALNDVEDRIRGAKVGADNFISKPANYSELKILIEYGVRRKKRIDERIPQQQVQDSCLMLMQLKDPDLLALTLRRKGLCAKVGRLLSLSEHQFPQLLTAACMLDIGRIVAGPEDDHALLGEMIIRPLKMGEWLGPFVANHHKNLQDLEIAGLLADEEISVVFRILVTVSRYLYLCYETGDKETSLLTLEAESLRGEWDEAVVVALRQLRQDETFIQQMTNS